MDRSTKAQTTSCWRLFLSITFGLLLFALPCAAQVTPSATLLNFGSSYVGEAGTQNFTLTNAGTTPVVFSASLGATGDRDFSYQSNCCGVLHRKGPPYEALGLSRMRRTDGFVGVRWLRTSAFGVPLIVTMAASPQSGDPPQAGETMRVPFEYASSRNSLLVHVSINGKSALLILDTGSAHTVLRPEVLGLKRSAVTPARTSPSGGAFMGDAIGREVTLQVGDRTWRKYRIVVMDLSQVLAAYQESPDGVLGLDFLQNYRRVAIDLHERIIMLAR